MVTYRNSASERKRNEDLTIYLGIWIGLVIIANVLNFRKIRSISHITRTELVKKKKKTAREEITDR